MTIGLGLLAGMVVVLGGIVGARPFDGLRGDHLHAAIMKSCLLGEIRVSIGQRSQLRRC